MEIRRLDAVADLRDALRAHARAWETAYADILPDDRIAEVTERPSEDELRERYADLRDECFLVADVDGAVRGYAFARWGGDTKEFVSGDAAGLKELYVHPDYWGDGIGSALVDAVVDRVPDEYGALELETLAENDPARGFYEARGFEAVEELTTELGACAADSVVYRRDL